jgi:hypothetical protein
MVGRGTGYPAQGLCMDSGVTKDYSSDYRFMALRGPLVIAGWGYDTQGKPVPNESDTEDACNSGIFKTTGLTDKFLPDFLTKSHTWPVAPLDVRLDKGRGVWTLSDSQPQLYCEIMYHLDKYGPVPARILDTGTFYRESGTSGNITGYQSISGWTESDNIYASGTRLLFEYSQTYSRYNVMKDSEVTILITGTISGAEWDRNITGMKPYRFHMPCFEVYRTNPNGVGNGSGWLTYNTCNMITGWNKMTDVVTPGNGQAYIATLVNGWLDNASCRTVAL